jgi:hypothetical protein
MLVALTASMAGVRVYAQSRPQPSPDIVLDGFGLCDGKPCFLGIKPGVTTFEEAKKVVVVRYPDTIIDGNHMIIPYGTNTISIESSDSIVDRVQIDALEGSASIPLRSVITKFGPPCAVELILLSCLVQQGCPIEYIDIHYDSASTSISVLSFTSSSYIEAERLDANIPITHLILNDNFVAPGMYFSCPKSFSGLDYDSHYIPWMGFASIRQRYFAYEQARSNSR